MLILGENIYIIMDNISVSKKKTYLKNIPEILNQIIYLVFQAQISKKRLSEEKLKIKSSHTYYNKSYIKCYNFY